MDTQSQCRGKASRRGAFFQRPVAGQNEDVLRQMEHACSFIDAGCVPLSRGGPPQPGCGSSIAVLFHIALIRQLSLAPGPKPRKGFGRLWKQEPLERAAIVTERHLDNAPKHASQVMLVGKATRQRDLSEPCPAVAHQGRRTDRWYGGVEPNNRFLPGSHGSTRHIRKLSARRLRVRSR